MKSIEWLRPWVKDTKQGLVVNFSPCFFFHADFMVMLKIPSHLFLLRSVCWMQKLFRQTNMLNPKMEVWKMIFLSHMLHGIFTYIYHKSKPNVGKYFIHGAFGYIFLFKQVVFRFKILVFRGVISVRLGWWKKRVVTEYGYGVGEIPMLKIVCPQRQRQNTKNDWNATMIPTKKTHPRCLGDITKQFSGT